MDTPQGLPPGAIPAEEFQPAASPQVPSAQPVKAEASGLPPGAIPADEFESAEEKYGTLGQQAIAGLEGVAKGVAGPLAPLAERALGVNPEGIRMREEVNPWTHGIGETGGLAAGMFTGTGEASLLTKAGEAASGLTKLGAAANLAKEAALTGGATAAEALKAAEAVTKAGSYASRIGSEAAKQAAEMAVLQSGDELSKLILQDPNASAEAAIGNIGLATALGGAGGAFMTGAVSPLWHATVGNKLEGFLNKVQAHVNGGVSLELPATVAKAYETLGIEPHPLMKAALSGDKDALMHAQNLYRAQNPEMLELMRQAPKEAQEAIAQSLGVPLEDLAVFSNHESGEAVREQAIKEIAEKVGPIAEALNKRDAEAAHIMVPDEARLDFGNRIMEKAVHSPGTDSDAYKIYEKVAERVRARPSIRELDELGTQLYKSSKSLIDGNEKDAYRDLYHMLQDFKEAQISQEAMKIGEQMAGHEVGAQAERAAVTRGVGSEGIRVSNEAEEALKTATQAGREEGRAAGAQAINERADINRNYAELKKKLLKLTDGLGIREARGAESLKRDLKDLTAEQIIKKFSTKGDVGFQEFLKAEFPQAVELIRQHEAKAFLSPSVKTVEGQLVVDTKNLSKRVESMMKGSPEHAEFVLPKGTAEKIEAAKIIQDSISRITSIKDSGTPAGLAKVFSHFGAGAAGVIGYLAGHNPVGSALVGELGQYLSKSGPEALKLGWLKFLGTDKPVSSAGMKAAVDFMHNAYKGEHVAAKAAKSIFEGSSKVLVENLMPNQKDRDKLDKQIAKLEKNPEGAFKLAQGDVNHYMPEHQTALTASAVKAAAYLQTLKPQVHRVSPLDAEVQPSEAEKARYNRALDIANQPAMVLQHVKDGTLQISDIQDLHAMYPAYYQALSAKVSHEMIDAVSKGVQIPYKTRMGLSLFLGQAIDSSMLPQNIMAAQPPPPQPPQQQAASKSRKGTQTLGKHTNSLYQTAGQSAERDRSGRD